MAFSVGKRLKITVKPSALAVWLCFFAFDSSVYTLLLLLAILAHEAGHLGMLYLFSVQRVQVVFSSFGAEMNYDGCFLSHKQQIFVSLGGVFVNFLIALVCLALPIRHPYVAFLAVGCLCLGVLNLVPVKGLDGGKALESLLLCYLDAHRVFGWMRRVSVFFLLLLFGLSVAVLIASGFNFSLLLFTLYLSLSIFR